MNYLVFFAVPVPLTTQEPAETKICQSCELYCMTKHNSFADVCNECQCEPPKGKYLQIPSFKIIIVFLQIITMHLDQKSNHPQCLRCIQTYLHLNAILIWKFPKQINTLIITSDIDFCKLNICLLKKITQPIFRDIKRLNVSILNLINFSAHIGTGMSGTVQNSNTCVKIRLYHIAR